MKPYFLHAHTRPLTCTKFNKDGDIFFTTGKDANLVAWYSSNGNRIGSYSCGRGVIWSCDCSFDSKCLIAASADQKIKIFDVCSGRLLKDIPEGGPCKYVEWNTAPGKQNKYVLAHDVFTNSKKQIKAVSIETGEPRTLWSTHDYQGRCIQANWGPFDKTIISSHDDGSINVWDASTGAKIKDFEAHSSAVTCVSFSEDRCLMLTCSKDSTAKLWDTREYKCSKVYEADRPLNACDISPLYNASEPLKKLHVFIGGGQAAADVTTTGASEGKFEALIYHMAHAYLIGQVKGHFGPINSIATIPDGSGFVSGGEDGYARLYHFDNDYFTDKFN